MRTIGRLLIPAAMLALAVPAAAARETIGVAGRWAAFRDTSPRRCFAISRPLRAPRARGWQAFLSIARWPSAGTGAQVHARLSRAIDRRARVTLTIGERRFALLAGESDAWAPDPATDRAIITAMRGGRSLSIESVTATGAPFADVYTLDGAATAIDAAMLACAGART